MFKYTLLTFNNKIKLLVHVVKSVLIVSPTYDCNIL